jgi:uncharacterized protein
VGVPLFYGYGLALYRYLGPFYSVLGGAGFFVIQGTVAHLWLARFHYGPLEWLWRAGTFLNFRTPMRRRSPGGGGPAGGGERRRVGYGRRTDTTSPV